MGTGKSGYGNKKASKKTSRDGTIVSKSATKIETEYIEGRGWRNGYYKDEVLSASTDGKGNLTFSYASPVEKTKTAKTNKTNYITYEEKAGAVNGKSFGINWDKVQSISGQTYSLRDEAKKHGLKFDGATKSWRRK